MEVHHLGLRQVGGLVEDETAVMDVGLEWLHRAESLAAVIPDDHPPVRLIETLGLAGLRLQNQRPCGSRQTTIAPGNRGCR
jgi:hypothetical protein